ncbi:MAG: tetratricopeptide repeat protein [Gemmatimonadota bacterium]
MRCAKVICTSIVFASLSPPVSGQTTRAVLPGAPCEFGRGKINFHSDMRRVEQTLAAADAAREANRYATAIVGYTRFLNCETDIIAAGQAFDIRRQAFGHRGNAPAGVRINSELNARFLLSTASMYRGYQYSLVNDHSDACIEDVSRALKLHQADKRYWKLEGRDSAYVQRNAYLFGLRGKCYQQQGAGKEAERDYKAAAKLGNAWAQKALAALDQLHLSAAALDYRAGQTLRETAKTVGVDFEQDWLEKALAAEQTRGAPPAPPVATPAAPQAPRATQSEAEHARAGDEAFSAGDYAAAARHFEEAVRVNPSWAEAHQSLGNAYLQLGRMDAAIASLTHAIERKPQLARAHYYRGIAYNDSPTSRHDLALRDYDRAIQLDPQHAHVYFTRGWTKLYLGDGAGAAEDAQAFLRMAGWQHESAPYAAFAAFLGYSEDGASAKAKKILALALGKTPSGSWPRRVVRFLNVAESDLETEANALLAAAMNDDQRTEAHAYIGMRKLDSSSFCSEAREHFEWVRDQGNKRFVEHHLALAQLNWGRGEYCT